MGRDKKAALHQAVAAVDTFLRCGKDRRGKLGVLAEDALALVWELPVMLRSLCQRELIELSNLRNFSWRLLSHTKQIWEIGPKFEYLKWAKIQFKTEIICF